MTISWLVSSCLISRRCSSLLSRLKGMWAMWLASRGTAQCSVWKREREGWSSDNRAGSVTRLSQTHRKSSAHNAQPPAQNGAGLRATAAGPGSTRGAADFCATVSLDPLLPD